MEALIGIIIWIIVMAIKYDAKHTEEAKKMPSEAESIPKATTYQNTTTANTDNTSAAKVLRETVDKGKLYADLAKKKLEEELKGELGGAIRELDKELGGVISEASPKLSKMIQAPNQAEPESEPQASAMEQVRQRRMENRNTTILERAQSNTQSVKEDVTLQQLEAEHGHSAHVAPAVHNHPEDVLPESMLGSVEDLIVMGYDGKLCFERDFVGEGLDMISRFTVPSDLPEYNVEKVS